MPFGRWFASSVRYPNGSRWLPTPESRTTSQPTASGVARDVILTDGTIVPERLLALSDIERFYSYTYRETPLPVENFVSTVQLRPITDGNRTLVEGRAQFDSPTAQQAQQVADELRTGVY